MTPVAMISTSRRYCKKCKEVTTWMLNPNVGHSRCIQCGGMWSRRPIGMKFPKEISADAAKERQRKAKEKRDMEKKKAKERRCLKKARKRTKQIKCLMRKAKRRMQMLENRKGIEGQKNHD